MVVINYLNNLMHISYNNIKTISRKKPNYAFEMHFRLSTFIFIKSVLPTHGTIVSSSFIALQFQMNLSVGVLIKKECISYYFQDRSSCLLLFNLTAFITHTYFSTIWVADYRAGWARWFFFWLEPSYLNVTNFRGQ